MVTNICFFIILLRYTAIIKESALYSCRWFIRTKFYRAAQHKKWSSWKKWSKLIKGHRVSFQYCKMNLNGSANAVENDKSIFNVKETPESHFNGIDYKDKTEEKKHIKFLLINFAVLRNETFRLFWVVGVVELNNRINKTHILFSGEYTKHFILSFYDFMPCHRSAVEPPCHEMFFWHYIAFTKKVFLCMIMAKYFIIEILWHKDRRKWQEIASITLSPP